MKTRGDFVTKKLLRTGRLPSLAGDLLPQQHRGHREGAVVPGERGKPAGGGELGGCR